jgi:hypothetical protein
MIEILYKQLPESELLALMLKVIDEYQILTTTTNSIHVIEEKRAELFKIYEIIKEKGIQ